MVRLRGSDKPTMDPRLRMDLRREEKERGESARNTIERGERREGANFLHTSIKLSTPRVVLPEFCNIILLT